MKAFPCGEGIKPYEYGMDLRDYFAAQATEQDIQEYMWEVVTQTSDVLSKIQVRNREQARYAYADAMIKEREKNV